jgi:hypothetical protein
VTRTRRRPAGAISVVVALGAAGALARARVAAATIAIVGTAVLVSACGAGSPGGPSSVGASAQVVRQSLAFSRCMRTHGVSGFPDPDSGGDFAKATLAQLAANNPQYQPATDTCQHLLPISRTSGPTQAELQHVRVLGLSFARCMRSHGVDLPDPDSSGRIPDPATLQPPIDQGSPQFEAANHACGKYRPPYMPSNASYNAFVRSGGS